MRFSILSPAALVMVALFSAFTAGQSITSQTQWPVVPRLVGFSGQTMDKEGKSVFTLSIYGEQFEGSLLWMETQNVQADIKGNYTVQSGANSSEGLPPGLSASGEARWLRARINNGGEQSRVLLLSVPHALKTADSQTLGSLLPSPSVLAAGSPP